MDLCVLDRTTMTSVRMKGQSDLWIRQVLRRDILPSRPQGRCHFQERREEGGRFVRKNDALQAEKVEEVCRVEG